LGIRGIPTVVMFKDGQEIKRRDGAMGSGHVHPMGSITRRLAVLDVGARMRLLLTLFRLFPLDALSL